MTDADLDKLEALAKAATQGPWTCKEGSTSYPECDDKDFWAAVLSPAGREVITLHERYHHREDDRADYDFDAAFIAAANPATILDLIASARRDAEEIERALELLNEARNGGFFIGTEAGPKVEQAKDVLRSVLARAAHTGEG